MTDHTLMWTSGVVPPNGDYLKINGVPSTINADGVSDPVNISAVSVLMVSVTVGVPTGTTPEFSFYLDVQDTAGNWLQVLALPKLTAVGYTYASVGPGTATGYVLTDRVRFRWVKSAGSTWPNVIASLAGR